MRITKLALAVVTLLTLYTQANAQWKTTQADVAFTIKNAGLNVSGTFSGFQGDIDFSTNQITKAKINATVQANTIKTGIDARDKHLKKAEYFNIAEYPVITMQSKFFAKAGDNNYRGYFKLTIKGITKDIMIPFTFVETGNKATIKGEFELDRLDYKVGEKSFVLSNNVKVLIKLNLEKI
jgi:polyisoprenoid-binding protein YceI